MSKWYNDYLLFCHSYFQYRKWDIVYLTKFVINGEFSSHKHSHKENYNRQRDFS